MARLSRSDLESVLDFAGEAAVAAREPERVDARLLTVIGRLIDAELIRYVQSDPTYRTLRETALPHSLPPFSDDLLEALQGEDNPYRAYAARTRQRHFGATRIFDIVDRKAFRRTTLYRLVPYADAPTVQVWMPGQDGSTWRLEAVRPGREFSDRELALLDAVRPWLELYEDRRVLGRQIAALRTVPPDQRFLARLSAREHEVLDHLADGASNQNIADALQISPGTVRKHLENIYAKLQVTNRTAALARTGRTTAIH